MTVPAPPQVRQVLEIEKKPWLSEVTPRPLQSGQIFGEVPGAAPVPWHAVQPTALTTGTLRVTQRILEGHAHRHLDVRAPWRRGRRGAGAAAAAAPVEQAAEQVAQVEALAVAHVEALEAARRRALTRPERLAEGVVLLPLLLVGQRVVRLLHLLEPLLRRRVPRVVVGVVLAGELAVRLLDLVVRRALGHAEHLVVISHRSGSPRRRPCRSTRPRGPAGRRGRPAGSRAARPRRSHRRDAATARATAPRARAGRTRRPAPPRSRPGRAARARRSAAGGRAARPPPPSPPRDAPRRPARARGCRARAAAPRPPTRWRGPSAAGRRGRRACGSCRSRPRRGAGRRDTPPPCAAPRRAPSRRHRRGDPSPS